MATVSIGDELVQACLIDEPRRGVWVADVELASESELSGQVSIDFEDGPFSFVGTVIASGVDVGSTHARIVGGSDGLSTSASAKYYRAMPFSVPFSDLMVASGETAGDVSAAFLAHFEARWHRQKTTVKHALDAMADRAGVQWRIDRDGTLRVGVDSFDDLEDNFGALESKRMPAKSMVEYSVDAPGLRPGFTFDGFRIRHVRTDVTSGSLRQTVWT